MIKIKLCCLIDPMPEKAGMLTLLTDSPGKVRICKECYTSLVDSIPEGIRSTPSGGVWDAVVEYVNFKVRQEFIQDDS